MSYMDQLSEVKKSATIPTLKKRFAKILQDYMEWLYEEDLPIERFINRINCPIGALLKIHYQEELEERKSMSHTDQLSELIQLWNCLNNAQREGYLRLLRTIVEEMKHDDKAAIQNVRNGD